MFTEDHIEVIFHFHLSTPMLSNLQPLQSLQNVKFLMITRRGKRSYSTGQFSFDTSLVEDRLHSDHRFCTV